MLSNHPNIMGRSPTFSSFGIGNVDGPASSTDNAIALFSGTTGRLIKNSVVTITGAGASQITGGAGNMVITSGTGNSRTLVLQTTTSGGTATTALTLGADQSATFAAGIAVATLSSSANITVGAGLDLFNGSVRISDNTTSLAPVYLQSGEPGASASNVIISNNYYGVNGGASARKNTSIGAAYISLNSATPALSFSVISSGGAATSVQTISATGVAVSGTLTTTGLITNYNGLATAGNGVVSVQGAGSATAQTSAAASVSTYTNGASDSDFLVSANVLVTTSTTHNFTVTCSYTDEGNTARTLTLPFSQVTGTILTAITNVTGAGPYEGVQLHIRAKASTAITIATTGTFTSVTYNVRGSISKVQ